MSNTALPAALANRQRRSIIDDAVQGLGSARGAHLSIRGGRFRLINATGVETPLATHYIDMIIIDANDKPARVFFDGPYDPNSDVPPACYSDNGTGPSINAMMPQAPTCQVCPHNIRGSAETFNHKPTTACDNRKKVAFILPDDSAVNVYEFQVPPGSLSNLRAYGAWIGQQASGIEGRRMDIADFVTRVSFDPDKQFVMQFQPVAFADDDVTIQMIEYIDANKLSDAAVGRLDVALPPEIVQARLAAPGQQAQIAAPAQPAQPQGQTFTMPQRPAPAQIAGGQAAPQAQATNGAGAATPAAPPKRRGRQAAQQQAPAGASAAAPFVQGAAASAAPTLPARAAATQTAASPSNAAGYNVDDGIPDFLKRQEGGPPNAGQQHTPPRFGVGAAPPPPDAIMQAMNLPTRRG